jgi:hypothetical protein
MEDLLAGSLGAAGDPDKTIPVSLVTRRAWGGSLIWFDSSAYQGLFWMETNYRGGY